MKIRNEPVYLTQIDIDDIQKHYNAKYVFESPLFIDDRWEDEPSLIFYNQIPHPTGSNYFAIRKMSEARTPRHFITNGISAVQDQQGNPIEIAGILANNGDVIYSHCRHDFRKSDDGSVMIDGGRDYLRYSMESATCQAKLVPLHVVKGELVVKVPKCKWRSIEEDFVPTSHFTG